MRYIGIDLGSSYIKSVIIDLTSGRILESKRTPTPEKRAARDPLVFEVPAAKLCEIVKEQIRQYTESFTDIGGLVLSTQMHGFIYAIPDREDMYVSWQDMRCLNTDPKTGKSFLSGLEELIPPQEMETHGVYLKPSLGFCNLMSLLQKEAALSREGTLYTLGSYIIKQLTENNVCHISNAAPLGLVNVKDRCWNRELIRKLGLDRVKLPRLAEDDFAVCGTYTVNGQTLKVHPDYGDMQVSVLGSRPQDGDVVVNIATASQVIRYSRDFEPGRYEIRPYFENSYLYTISNMPGGRNLDVLVRFLKEAAEELTGRAVEDQTVWKYIHEHAGENSDGLCVETCFYQNPYYPDGGSVRAITQNNLHIGSLFTAAYTDMAQTYWKHIQELGNAETVRRIICAGGVSWKTPALCRAIADVSEKEQLLSPFMDEALSGMYQISLVCSGLCRNLSECGAYHLHPEGK